MDCFASLAMTGWAASTSLRAKRSNPAFLAVADLAFDLDHGARRFIRF
jgi:hypothetical protein